MFKKITLTILIAGLVVGGLSGCSSTNKAYTQGINLYNKGDYNSLVQAKKFFDNYEAKNPNDKNAVTWSSKVDADLLSKAESLTNQSYNQQDYSNALKYVTVAKSIAPDDKTVQKAYSSVKKSYDDQKNYDTYVDFAENRYIDTKNIIDQWDNGEKLIEEGKAPYTYIVLVAKNLYPEVSALRDQVNAESFNLSGDNNQILLDANTTLFAYTVKLENELSDVVNLAGASKIDDYTSLAYDLSEDQFNQTFVTLQQKITSYTTELDVQGKPKRNIKNTLNFTQAYLKKQQELAAEAQKTAAQPSSTTAPATTTK